jgi:hypothetical protein
MRCFLKHTISIAILALPLTSFAQVPNAIDQLKPYLQVKPVDGDENKVRGFFSPSCGYSKMYFQFFKNLSMTLPTGTKFEFTPLVNKRDGISYALSFEAVKKYYPSYVNNYVEASLVGVQDKGLSTLNWSAIERIGKAARIPASIPKLVHDHFDDLRADVQSTMALQHNLTIANTPAVSVAGTYIVTPEFTNGDAALFSQLVNGIISMSR